MTIDGKQQDIELIDRVRKGDSRAFRELLDKHYTTIYRMAFRFCGNRTDAEDVTQMSSLKLAQTITGFKGDAAFTTWLYKLVLNSARDWRRSQARHERGSVGLDDVEFTVGDNGQTPEAKLETTQKLAAIHKLPEPEREIIWLVYGEGLTHKEVAEIIGCAEGTISWRISEARKMLKEGGVSA